jgi:molybdate transport system substrate-binding protein
MSRRSIGAIAAGVVLVAGVAGCSEPTNTTTSVTVFASSSLIKPFTEIGRRFKDENPGTSVEFIFANSSELAAELMQGASADVFASGDGANMATVAQDGLVAAAPVEFASNSLVIAVAPGNPHRIASFADLNRPGLRVAVCAPPGGCAFDTQSIEGATGVQLRPVTAESSPADVVAEVTAGKADAAVVYTTAALGAGDNISWFRFPEAADATTGLFIAPLGDSEEPDAATKFIDLVTDDTGKSILSRAGFGEPGQPAP